MDVEKRIETLEKQVRLYRRVGLLAVCLIAGVLIVGAVKPVPKVIEAEKFVLRDGKGRMRGHWETVEAGPRFLQYDENGKKRMGLNLAWRGSGLFFHDANEKIRISIGVAGLGSRRGIVVPAIIFKDENKMIRMMMSVYAGRSELVLNDSSEDERATLYVRPNGETALKLWDSNQKIIWQAPDGKK